MYKKIPYWILSGIIIFLVIILAGLILSIMTLGKFNFLFWLILPSILFEDLFENCCYTFSNDQIANLIFAIGFWFIIGSLIGFILCKKKKSC